MAKRYSDGIYKRKDRGKESKHWWVSYTDAGGKRVRQSTGTADYKEAQALLAKWRLEVHREKKWGEAPVRTFDELMLKYIRAVEKYKKDPGRDKLSLKHLYPVFSGKDINRLNTADIRAYIAKRKEEGAAASTINKEVGAFSSAINYAKREWDWAIHNPCSGCKQKEPEGIVRWITRAEAVALIEAAKKDYRAAAYLPEFIALALHTGCRRGELLGLEWSRVNRQDRLILLEAVHTKAGRRRSVPLNATAYEAIRRRARFRAEHCPDSKWVFCTRAGVRIQDIKGSFGTACRRAGIENFRIHDLRHTCAAWLVTAGVPLAEVRDLLGHKTIQMTERYAHLAPENIRSAVDRLDGVSHICHVPFSDEKLSS